jgi:hypothetical protein
VNTNEDWSAAVKDTPLYTGSLRGYREFAAHYKPETGFVLKPIAYSAQFAMPDDEGWINAICGNRGEEAYHESPSSSCKCGFYVSYFPGQSFYPFDLKYAFAVTENSGKLLLSTKGFRSAKMKITAYYLPGFLVKKHRDHLSESKMLDGIPRYTSLKRMYEDFPQADLTSLIGEDNVKASLKHAEMSALHKQYAKHPWRTLIRHPHKFLSDF